MDDLIKKLESAECGSRELDRQITETAFDDEVCDGPADNPVCRHKDDVVWYNVPHYTTSLDAALTLVPEGMMIADFSQAPIDRAGPWRCGIYDDEGIVAATAGRATGPLALCIAALKARQVNDQSS